MHHFHGAACETEGHGPEGTLAGPIDEIVDARDGVFDFVVDWDTSGSCQEFVYSVETGDLLFIWDGGTASARRKIFEESNISVDETYRAGCRGRFLTHSPTNHAARSYTIAWECTSFGAVETAAEHGGHHGCVVSC